MTALLAGALLAGAAPARAQTILHLAETASVPAHPDELAATLQAEAASSTAADAQQRVNTIVSDALNRAHQVAGVAVSTGSYTAWRTGPTPQDQTERWQASQSLELHGRDGPALLALVGELQQHGLAVNQLGWRLSEQGGRDARSRAIADALQALRGRADAAASLIGMRFEAFKEIRLDTPRPAPMPRMMMAAPAAANVAAMPPNAEAEDMPVSATAEADVLLKPR